MIESLNRLRRLGRMTAPTSPTKAQLLELVAALGTAQWQDFSASAARHGLTGVQAKLLAHLKGPMPMRGLATLLVCATPPTSPASWTGWRPGAWCAASPTRPTAG
ncbi:hypothetical protein GCM10020221_00910 [Streptomyces thioluteus]|uniref:Transposase n=1 Tax=Streptomyces thioluteus TaxID=66431 RepID=A0ABN3W9Z8_STRTU